MLEAAETVSEYCFDHVPDDLVPYWDYQDPGIPEVPRDSAAAAIAAGGFLTLAEVHPSNRPATRVCRESSASSGFTAGRLSEPPFR